MHILYVYNYVVTYVMSYFQYDDVEQLKADKVNVIFDFVYQAN